MFKKQETNQAYLKAGILGLQGSGKTFTAKELAIGFHDLLLKKQLPGGIGTVFMVDTETGSGWLVESFRKAGIALEVDHTRSFATLLDDMDHVARVNGILIIDSITHFWQDLVLSYKSKQPEFKQKRVTFEDWGAIKNLWKPFTDRYLTQPNHVIMLGRQGYEYAHIEDEDGKKQISKVGVKMKGETETGYEPSLLVLMQREQAMDDNGKLARTVRTATILKDRSNTMDGICIENPTFADFMPHIASLNLGGEVMAFDPKADSAHLFVSESERNQLYNQRKIVLEEVKQAIQKRYPSQSAEDKQGRFNLMEEIFKTRAWTLIEKLHVDELKTGYESICTKFGWEPLPTVAANKRMDSQASQTISAEETPF